MAVTQRIAQLLEKVAAAVTAERHVPESTYRFQFHKGFTFRDAERLVPYLHELGITDCYASPYLKARPGSMHGYDISDHRVLNPEIGSEEDYDAWVRALQAHGLGQVLDIVPNHMGIMGNENAWWNDVLENGPSSPYASFFDIDWYPVKPQLREKVLLPILGDPYGKALESQQLSITYEAGAFAAHYAEHRFPIAPESALRVLRHGLPELEEKLGKESAELMEYGSILTALTHLPPRSQTDPAKIAERQREKEVIKRRLATLVETCPAVREFIEHNVALFNGTPGDPRSFDLLDDLLNDQAYRLSFWRVAADEINYRRFFDVNELAALSMEKAEVFAATHVLILRLLRQGKVTGLRIDHPDGLYDPLQYLERLQSYFLLQQARKEAESEPGYSEEAYQTLEQPLLEEIDRVRGAAGDGPWRRPLYVIVEKILGRDEPLPEDWPVHGTTGYEFLNALNGLFVDPSHAALLSRIYSRWTGMGLTFADIVYPKKFLILQVSLSSELHVLAHQLDRLSEKNRWSRDFTLNSLRHALREIIACFPVYRSYISEKGIPDRDHLYVETAVVRARRKNPAISATIFDFVRDMLLLKSQYPVPESGQALQATYDRAEQLRFVGKFQQVTAPVMAKGVEDTALYDYNRLLSLNEVGGDPGQFGWTPAAFHRHNQERLAHYPRGLSASSTHDTKRSEDVRARLNVLSELPQEWHKRLSRWNRLNKRLRVQVAGVTVPDRNAEYQLYQTLLGAWPLEASPEPHAQFVDRMQRYMRKAIHEAKVHTSWINPNPPYDEAIHKFIEWLLHETKNRRFLEDFRAFHKVVSHYGLFNSLSQTLLKIASPSVPDIYQGTELWDFSLVDPDNRRPVNYELRQRLLDQLQQRIANGGAQLNRVEHGAGNEQQGASRGDTSQRSFDARGATLTRLRALARELTKSKEDGRIKLYVTYQALRCRREHSGLFSAGEYWPVEAAGGRSDNVVAFVRRLHNRWALAAAPRLITRLISPGGELPFGREVWGDTVLSLPPEAAKRRWRNVFTGEVLSPPPQPGRAALPAADVFANFPVALFLGQDEDEKH